MDDVLAWVACERGWRASVVHMPAWVTWLVYQRG